MSSKVVMFIKPPNVYLASSLCALLSLSLIGQLQAIHELCNLNLEETFTYGSCLFSNQTSTLMFQFDDQHLEQILLEQEIDQVLIAQLSQHVGTFLHHQFCAIVLREIVRQQHSECSAHHQISSKVINHLETRSPARIEHTRILCSRVVYSILTEESFSKIKRDYISVLDLICNGCRQLSAKIVNNLQLEQSLVNQANCWINDAKTVDKNVSDAACKLVKMIEQHTECSKLETSHDSVKCLTNFIHKNLPARYQNKLEQALQTGGEAGLVYSLRSLCIKKSMFIAFTLIDVEDYLGHLHVSRNHVNLVQSAMVYFLQAIRQALLCSPAGEIQQNEH